jgi:hypothetical protein
MHACRPNPTALSILAALVICLGCNLPPTQRGTPEADTGPARVQDEVMGYHQFQVGSYTGYVRTVRGSGGDRHEVYDQEMQMVGAYTDLGKTFRYRGNQEPEVLGNYSADDSLRALFGIQSQEVPVVRTPMKDALDLEDMEKP